MASEILVAAALVLFVSLLPMIFFLVGIWRIGSALLDIAKSHKSLADTMWPGPGKRDIAESLDAISRR